MTYFDCIFIIFYRDRCKLGQSKINSELKCTSKAPYGSSQCPILNSQFSLERKIISFFLFHDQLKKKIIEN